MSETEFLTSVEALLAAELAPKKATELAAQINAIAPKMQPQDALLLLAELIGAKSAPAGAPKRGRPRVAKAGRKQAKRGRPRAAAVEVAPRKRGRPTSTSSKQSAMKLIYWAMVRKIEPEFTGVNDAHAEDAAILKAADQAYLSELEPSVRARLAKKHGGTKAKASKPAKVKIAPAAIDNEPAAVAAAPAHSAKNGEAQSVGLTDAMRAALGV